LLRSDTKNAIFLTGFAAAFAAGAAAAAAAGAWVAAAGAWVAAAGAWVAAGALAAGAGVAAGAQADNTRLVSTSMAKRVNRCFFILRFSSVLKYFAC
jgi:hypothetical protein